MTNEEVVDLIRDAGFGLLATVEGDQPRVRPMMPYLSDDNTQLYLALLGRSRTISQVKANPRVEICFVDRKMWYCRLSGLGKISQDTDKKQVLWDNIPMLRQYFGGIDDPNFIMMVVDIKDVEAMTPHGQKPEHIPLN